MKVSIISAALAFAFLTASAQAKCVPDPSSRFFEQYRLGAICTHPDFQDSRNCVSKSSRNCKWVANCRPVTSGLSADRFATAASCNAKYKANGYRYAEFVGCDCR